MQQSSSPPISFKAGCCKQRNQKPQRGTVRTHQTEPTISDCGNITMLPKGVGLALQDEPKRRAQNQLTESETVSVISDMACTISHDMRHSLSTIYANAEFLECPDMSAHARADLVREIQEVVLEMKERLDSLLQFACSGRESRSCMSEFPQLSRKPLLQ
jgi:K+-sensing histidine kinase KdpD